MQGERHYLSYRAHIGIFGQHAAGIKGLTERAVIVKHQIRIVPLSAKLLGGVVLAAIPRIIVRINHGGLALEIDTGMFLKASADV